MLTLRSLPARRAPRTTTQSQHVVTAHELALVAGALSPCVSLTFNRALDKNSAAWTCRPVALSPCRTQRSRAQTLMLHNPGRAKAKNLFKWGWA